MNDGLDDAKEGDVAATLVDYTDPEFGENLGKLLTAAERLHLDRYRAVENLNRSLLVVLGAQAALYLKGMDYEWAPEFKYPILIWAVLSSMTFILAGAAFLRGPRREAPRIDVLRREDAGAHRNEFVDELLSSYTDAIEQNIVVNQRKARLFNGALISLCISIVFFGCVMFASTFDGGHRGREQTKSWNETHFHEATGSTPAAEGGKENDPSARKPK